MRVAPRRDRRRARDVTGCGLATFHQHPEAVRSPGCAALFRSALRCLAARDTYSDVDAASDSGADAFVAAARACAADAYDAPRDACPGARRRRRSDVAAPFAHAGGGPAGRATADTDV